MSDLPSLWSRLFLAVRERDVRLYACLRDASPVEVSEMAVGLELPAGFHFHQQKIALGTETILSASEAVLKSRALRLECYFSP